MNRTLPTRLKENLERFRCGTGIKTRMARGGLWLSMGSGVENGLRILLKMILARLLAPEAFGLLAIILAINGAFEAFTEIGIKEAVVQNPRGSERSCLNAAWWMALTRGVLLFGVGALLAPWVAHFYRKPEMTSMIRVALLAIVFNGALSVRAYVALKEMRYGPWVLINQGGNACGIVTAIVLGALHPNAWALVIGFLVEALARCIISYVACPFRPGFIFQKDTVQALLRYAGGMAGLPLLTMFYTRSDVFVVGKFCSTAQLGLYSMACSLAIIPDVLCATVIAPLLMPAFSSVQHDREQLIEHLLHSLKYLALIFLPLLTLMACNASFLLSTMYGRRYAVASPTLIIVCGAVALRIMGWGLVTTFFATGRPELSRRASLVRLVVLLAVIIPLVQKFGPAGAALAGLCSCFAWIVYNVFYVHETIGLPVRGYFSALTSGAMVSMAIVGMQVLWQWVVASG